MSCSAAPIMRYIRRNVLAEIVGWRRQADDVDDSAGAVLGLADTTSALVGLAGRAGRHIDGPAGLLAIGAGLLARRRFPRRGYGRRWFGVHCHRLVGSSGCST